MLHHTSDYLMSTFVFCVFGILLGGLYKSLFVIKNFLIQLFITPMHAMKAKGISDYKNASKAGGHTDHILDFIFCFLTGIIYLLIVYVTLDGIFRLYSVIIFLAVFFLSSKFLGSFFEKILTFLFIKTDKLLFSLSYILFFPARKLFAWLTSLLRPPLTFLHGKVRNIKSKHIMNQKFKETEKIIKNFKK